MTDFKSLADEDWRIVVDEAELNEPTICYPDPIRPRALVGPLVMIHVGSTVDNDEGEECLDLEGADGRNLAAVACLPQFAELFRWIGKGMSELNAVHFDSQHDYGRFMQELRARVDWITSCIDDRDETMNAGMHGFDRYRNRKGGE
jgi:hypothetical protein